jgi:hypothetical protein
MKHITYAEKSLLVGDEAADVLLEYAAALGKADSADTVTLLGYGADGDDVAATFLLNSGTVIMAESTTSSIPDPDNDDAIAAMRERLIRLTSSAPVRPSDESMPYNYEDLGLE